MKSTWTLLGLAAFAVAGVLGVLPWTLRGEARRLDLLAGTSRDLGLDVSLGGPVTIKLLPRPRLQVTDVGVRTPDRSIDLSAPALSGDLDLGALLRGRLLLASATLSSPTGTIDIDRAGQALAPSRDPGTAAGGDAPAALSRVTLRSGVLRLLSRRLGTDTIVTDLSGTLAASAAEGVAASGTGVWRGLAERFTLRVGARPAGVRRAYGAFLDIGSPAGSFSASGEVTGGAAPQFTGRVAASSTTPDRFFAALGFGPPWVDLGRFGLSGDAVARFGEVSLADAALRLNTSEFEGALGYRVEGGRGLIEGTLAAGRLDLEDLAGHAADREAADGIYRAPITPRLAELNLDLRLSAGEVVMGGARAREMALSLLCRDRALDVTLDEALAFGGTVKGRLAATFLPEGVRAHAELAVSAVDLGALGAALTGQERVTGALTGDVAADGQGGSLRDLVPTLAGTGRVSVVDGDFMGLSVSQALRRVTRRLPFGDDHSGRMTAFAAASSALRIDKGRVTFVDGKVAGPGMRLSFTGQGDLPRARVDILALASPTDAAGAPIAGAAGLPIEMRAGWGEPLTLLEQSRRLSLPALLAPGLDPDRIFP